MSAEENGRGEDRPVLTEVVGGPDKPAVPVLRDAVTQPPDAHSEAQIAAVQAELTTLAHDLTERLLNTALREMEAALFRQVSDRLREELPVLVEKVLREHLKTGR